MTDKKNDSIEQILEERARLDSLLKEHFSRQVAIMFTDIKGSTAYYEIHGDIDGRLMVHRHNEIVLPVISENRGTLLKTIGDATMSAYDDPAGVTAAFNLNLLERINRELGGTIPVENFSHRAIWNDVHARIEMHLVAACEMDFTVDGRSYAMAKGETIHSENSHKYGPRDANLLLRAGGWTPVATWDDADPAFALILAEATEFRSAP